MPVDHNLSEGVIETDVVAAVAVVVERPGRFGVADPEVAQELFRCAGAVDDGRIRFEGEPAVPVVGEVQRAAWISAHACCAPLSACGCTGETAYVEERDFDLHHLGTAVGTTVTIAAWGGRR